MGPLISVAPLGCADRLGQRDHLPEMLRFQMVREAGFTPRNDDHHNHGHHHQHDRRRVTMKELGNEP